MYNRLYKVYPVISCIKKGGDDCSMRNKSTPLYIQIKKHIETQINDGIYKPHDKLPSEAELAKKFNVSRITSKNAIARLVEEGKVYRIAGKGSFVKEESISDERQIENNQSLIDPQDKTKFIGLVMPEVVERHSSTLLSEIESAITDLGYSLIFTQSHHNTDREIKAIETMLQHNVEGLIIFPIDDETYNEKILQLTLNKFPIVLIDRYLKGIETAAVYSDNFQGAYQLTKILLDNNHKRIGLFTPPKFNTITIDDRIKGYEQALVDANIPIDRTIWFTDIYEDNHIDKTVDFLQKNPDITSIFAMNAYVAKIAVKAARKLNKNIPDDFTIVSFDRDQELDIYPIYTAQQNSTQIGKKAVELIQAQINKEKTENQIIVPVEVLFNNK